MSYYTEFERLIITSSLVGFNRQAISNVASEALDAITLSNMDIYIAASHGGDSRIIDSETKTISRQWSVLTMGYNAAHLLTNIANKVIKSCLYGSLRVRGKQILPSSYLSKFEVLQNQPKFVEPEVFAHSLERAIVTKEGLEHLRKSPFGNTCLGWMEDYQCFQPNGESVIIGEISSPEEVVAGFAVCHYISSENLSLLNLKQSAAACYLSNAVESEPPSHLRFVG